MNQVGVLIALAATISWSIGIFPFTEAARRLGVNPLNHVRLLLATILLLITAVLINATGFINIFSVHYYQAWIWFGLSGVIGLALGDYLAFKMYVILGARTGSVLTTFAPAATLIFGTYLLDEKINAIGVFGILVTIIGVITLSLGKTTALIIPENRQGKLRKGILAGILAAVCQGLGLVLAKMGFLYQDALSQTISPINATFIRMLISTTVLFSITLISGKKNEVIMPLILNKKDGLKFAVAGAFFGPFLAVSLSLLTITKLDVAISQTIFSLVPAFALLISLIFFKEKVTFQGFVGMLISILGVFILIWRNNLKAYI